MKTITLILKPTDNVPEEHKGGALLSVETTDQGVIATYLSASVSRQIRMENKRSASRWY